MSPSTHGLDSGSTSLLHLVQLHLQFSYFDFILLGLPLRNFPQLPFFVIVNLSLSGLSFLPSGLSYLNMELVSWNKLSNRTEYIQDSFDGQKPHGNASQLFPLIFDASNRWVPETTSQAFFHCL